MPSHRNDIHNIGKEYLKGINLDIKIAAGGDIVRTTNKYAPKFLQPPFNPVSLISLSHR